MGSKTNILGGAAMMLAQAFPAAAGTFPVTAECAENALRNAYTPVDPATLGLSNITLDISQPEPRQVIVGEYQNVSDVHNFVEKHQTTITIDPDGLLSSIETKGRFQNGSNGDSLASTARIDYSPLNSEFSVSSSPPVPATKNSILEDVTTVYTQRIERELMQCGSGLISSAVANSPFRLG